MVVSHVKKWKVKWESIPYRTSGVSEGRPGGGSKGERGFLLPTNYEFDFFLHVGKKANYVCEKIYLRNVLRVRLPRPIPS